MYTYVCIHTYTHTCMHTYIRTYVHTYIHTQYVHTYICTHVITISILKMNLLLWDRSPSDGFAQLYLCKYICSYIVNKKNNIASY